MSIGRLAPLTFCVLSCVLAPRAEADEKPPVKAGTLQTTIPVSVVARHILQDFQGHRSGEVNRLGRTADVWRKTLDPATFDRKKSWAAFVALVGGNENKPTTDGLIAEIALLYYLAEQDKQYVVLGAKVAPDNMTPTKGTIRLVPKDPRPKKVTIPYHGSVTVKLEAKIDDSEYSENRRVLWSRFCLLTRLDAGPFQIGGRVIESQSVWFGVLGGKEGSSNKPLIPLLRTSVGDGGKYQGGGLWEPAPPADKSFWLRKGWTKEFVPTGRWK